jgi:hypothetical protein
MILIVGTYCWGTMTVGDLEEEFMFCDSYFPEIIRAIKYTFWVKIIN